MPLLVELKACILVEWQELKIYILLGDSYMQQYKRQSLTIANAVEAKSRVADQRR